MPANHRHHRHGSQKIACISGFHNDGKHDEDMTVPKHLAIHRHVENPIGIGKSTDHDTNDGDDDGLQRFSKGVRKLICVTTAADYHGPTILSIYRPGRGEPVDGTLMDGRGAASTLKVNTEGATPARIE